MGALIRPALLLLLATVVALGLAAPATAAPEAVGLNAGMRAEALTVGPEGRLWFGGVQTVGLTLSETTPPIGTYDTVGYVSAAGKAIEFRWPTSELGRGVGGIAVGSDGALWFTETGGDAIGRVDSAGGLTNYPLPHPDSRPTAIVVGADGALWFTETGGDRVGRIDTAGTLNEYRLPAGSAPLGIAADDAESLWVTESGIGSIARLDPPGETRQFEIPGGGEPSAISAGPGGKLWFTIRGRKRIGSITPAGKVKEVAIPFRGADSVLPTADGTVWYANSRLPYVGSVTEAGHATASCVLHCGYPVISLALGPDEVRYGLGTYYVEGGGGSHQYAEYSGSSIETFEPPPLRAAVEAAAAVRRSRKVRVEVRCGGASAGARCHSRIQLIGAGSSGKPFSARRRLTSFSGETRFLTLPLRPFAAARLRRQGTLTVVAVAEVGGRATQERLTLRRG